MKPVYIEYVRAERWRTVWGATLFIVLVTVGAVGWQWAHRNGKARELATRIAVLTAQIQQAQKPATVIVDPRQASTDQVALLLRADYNKIFAVIENLSEPGAHLRSMTLNAPANILRLEYDLDSLATASVVTGALNGGYEHLPWRLASVSAIAGAAPVAQRGLFRGVWIGQLDKL
jgi:hypothetical protein